MLRDGRTGIKGGLPVRKVRATVGTERDKDEEEIGRSMGDGGSLWLPSGLMLVPYIALCSDCALVKGDPLRLPVVS